MSLHCITCEPSSYAASISGSRLATVTNGGGSRTGKVICQFVELVTGMSPDVVPLDIAILKFGGNHFDASAIGDRLLAGGFPARRPPVIEPFGKDLDHVAAVGLNEERHASRNGKQGFVYRTQLHQVVGRSLVSTCGPTIGVEDPCPSAWPRIAQA